MLGPRPVGRQGIIWREGVSEPGAGGKFHSQIPDVGIRNLMHHVAQWISPPKRSYDLDVFRVVRATPQERYELVSLIGTEWLDERGTYFSNLFPKCIRVFLTRRHLALKGLNSWRWSRV